MLKKKKYILSAILLLTTASFIVSAGVDFTNTRIMYSTNDATIIFYNTTGNDSIFVINSDLYGNTRLTINGSTGLVNISENLTIESFTVAGFVKNNAFGLLSGGNGIVIGDISGPGDGRWLKVDGSNMMLGDLDMNTNDIDNVNDLDVHNDLHVADKIENLNDATTYFDFDAGRIRYYAGGVEILDMIATLATFGVNVTFEQNVTIDNNLTVTNNITGYNITSNGYFIGDGSLLSNLSTFWVRVGTTLHPATNNDDVQLNGSLWFNGDYEFLREAINGNIMAFQVNDASDRDFVFRNTGAGHATVGINVDNPSYPLEISDDNAIMELTSDNPIGEAGIIFDRIGKRWLLTCEKEYEGDFILRDITNGRVVFHIDNTTNDFNLSSNFNITGNIKPAFNVTYDLGSPLMQWNNVYGNNFHGDGGNLINISGIGSNPFNQWLNTTDNATFTDLNLTGNLTVEGTTKHYDDVNISGLTKNDQPHINLRAYDQVGFDTWKQSEIRFLDHSLNVVGRIWYNIDSSATPYGVNVVSSANILLDANSGAGEIVFGGTTVWNDNVKIYLGNPALGFDGRFQLFANDNRGFLNPVCWSLGCVVYPDSFTWNDNLIDTDFIFNSSKGNAMIIDGATGDVNITGITNHSDHVLPTLNNTYNLGAFGLCWNTIYTNNVSSCSPLRLKTGGITKINITDDEVIVYVNFNATENIILPLDTPTTPSIGSMHYEPTNATLAIHDGTQWRWYSPD